MRGGANSILLKDQFKDWYIVNESKNKQPLASIQQYKKKGQKTKTIH